nr:hypothetical protein [Tanacetum cinerariifolium]
RVSLELIKEEDDVPLVDGVLNGALNAFGDIGGGELLERKYRFVDRDDDELSLELIKEEDDVPLVDGVLNGALNAFGDISLSFGDGLLKFRFEKMPWKCLRLKVNEEDDDLKMRIGNHFIKKK